MSKAAPALICLSVVLGLLAASGCGVKSAPMAPELVRPARILDLHATADPNGIKLDWGRPTHYTGGHSMRDLSSFVIIRAEGASPMSALVALPVTDSERFVVEHEFNYIDSETVIGHRYRYQIVSKTRDGYVSEASNEAEFTRVKPAPIPNPETYKLPAPTSLATPAS